MSILYNMIEMKRRTHQICSTFIAKQILQNIGNNCRVYPNITFKNPDKIYLADDCEIRSGVYMDGRTNKKTGIYLGKGVTIRNNTYVDCYGIEGFIYFDDYSSIGQNIYFGGNGGIYIGKNTMISGWSYFVSAKRNYSVNKGIPYKDQGEKRLGIHVGDNVWIASHSTILDGVKIGNNSVIGAGSIVVKDIPPNVLAFGNPAEVRRAL